MSVAAILEYISGCETLAACGLEEPRNSQDVLIESVGLVSLFCVFCHIVPICCFSMELKYITYALTQAHRNIHLWTILYIIVLKHILY